MQPANATPADAPQKMSPVSVNSAGADLVMATDALIRASGNYKAAFAGERAAVDSLAASDIAVMTVADAEARTEAAQAAFAAAEAAHARAEAAQRAAKEDHAACEAAFGIAASAAMSANIAAVRIIGLQNSDVGDEHVSLHADHQDACDVRDALANARRLATVHVCATEARAEDASAAMSRARDAVDATEAALTLVRIPLDEAREDLFSATAIQGAARAVASSRAAAREAHEALTAALDTFKTASAALFDMCAETEAAGHDAVAEDAIATEDAAEDAIADIDTGVDTGVDTSNEDGAEDAVPPPPVIKREETEEIAEAVPSKRERSPATESPAMKLRAREPAQTSAAGTAVRALFALYAATDEDADAEVDADAGADSDDDFDIALGFDLDDILERVRDASEPDDGVEVALYKLAGSASKGNFVKRYVRRTPCIDGRDFWALTDDGMQLAAAWGSG